MKKMFLIDTDIIIYWLTNKYPSIDLRIKQAGRKFVFISSITVAELYFGAYNSVKKDENIAVTEGLLAKMQIIPFDEKAGKYFGEIKTSLKRKGGIISDSDIFIAATAFSNNLILNVIKLRQIGTRSANMEWSLAERNFCANVLTL